MDVVLIAPEAFLHQEDAPYVKNIRAAGMDIIYPDDPTFTRGHKSEEETIEQLSKCQAIIAGGEFFTENVFAALPQLRVVARSGVGYDRVDVEAATRHGVAVAITPTANHESVAEHAFSLMFAIAKSVMTSDRLMRAGQWNQNSTLPIRGQTLGILGLGRIGRSVAVRATALGMKVLAHDAYPNESFAQEHGVQLVDLDTLLAQSDYVTIHCPLNDDTQGLFNRDTLAKMKAGSVLINTARGPLVVETDLVEALESGHIYGAGLDVFEQEPIDPENKLLKMDQVVSTPHVGSGDWLSRLDMAIEAADCIIKLQRNEWPEGAVVNTSLKDGWQW
jgi:D-3-phosphoglycerate dehydrogenase